VRQNLNEDDTDSSSQECNQCHEQHGSDQESGLAKKIHRMLERVTRIELAWPAWKVAVTARTSAISDGGVCSGDTVNDRTQS
jgi:hypothetical protein